MTPDVVFDTVTLLQGAGKPLGPAGSSLRLVMEDALVLHISREGFAELEDVLSRPRVRQRFPLLTDEHVETFLRGLRSKARRAADVPTVFAYLRDPDDEHILNLVIAAKARFLVTRDKDLLDLMKEGNQDGISFLQRCPGVRIVEPVAFLAAIRPMLEASP